MTENISESKVTEKSFQSNAKLENNKITTAAKITASTAVNTAQRSRTIRGQRERKKHPGVNRVAFSFYLEDI